MEENKIRIGITQGDINGVGYEVILKTFSDPTMLELCTPIIYGSPKVAAYHRKALDVQANFSIVNTASEAGYNRLSVVKKKDINDDDVLVLAGADRSQNHRIKLEYLQVTSGVGVRSVASLGLNISGEKFEACASGNGPVDAAIKALKKIVDRHMTLKEFTIQAISKGSDDVGKVHMQVEYDNQIYYGFGANTDIIAASVEAYIDCINKFKA